MLSLSWAGWNRNSLSVTCSQRCDVFCDLLPLVSVYSLTTHAPCGCLLVTCVCTSSQDADRILVMQKGRIVEQGTHPDLLALKGIYHVLVSRQLQSEILEQAAGVAGSTQV